MMKKRLDVNHIANHNREQKMVTALKCSHRLIHVFASTRDPDGGR